jgi:predicted transcriptional regulator
MATRKQRQSAKGSTMTAQRAHRAFELRKLGLSYREIAKELGTSHQTIAKDLKKVFDAYLEQSLEMRAYEVSLEQARLDEMWVSVYTDFKSGNLKAVEQLLKIMERRSKLLGLDIVQTSKQISVSVTPEQIQGMSDDELANLISQLERQ